jgi:carboxyl-terminal processing protease
MKLAEYIFDRGTVIFRSVDKSGDINNIKTINKKNNSIFDKDLPWVVLVDGMSASASEVLTNALIDLKKDVTIIGEPSFGKGKMQITFQDMDTVYAITTGEMKSPKGRDVDNISIETDVFLNIGEMFLYLDKSNDLAISKAIEIIHTL